MTCSIMFYNLFMYTVYKTTKLNPTLKHDSHIKQTSLIPIFQTKLWQNYDASSLTQTMHSTINNSMYIASLLMCFTITLRFSCENLWGKNVLMKHFNCIAFSCIRFYNIVKNKTIYEKTETMGIYLYFNIMEDQPEHNDGLSFKKNSLI